MSSKEVQAENEPTFEQCSLKTQETKTRYQGSISDS